MGILSRFKTIMASNINALTSQSDNPMQSINEHMRNLNLDLGKVRSETSTVQMEERRAKRALEECEAEIQKLHRYAVKSVQDGNDADALKFLDRKAEQSRKLEPLEASYRTASVNAANIKKMNDKLVADMERLEALKSELQSKLHAANAQQKLNALGGGSSRDGSMLDAAREAINLASDRAAAIAELNGEAEDELDKKFARLEEATREGQQPEDELDEIKKELGKPE